MTVVYVVLGLLFGGGLGYFLATRAFQQRLALREQADAGIREAARSEAETIRREALEEANRIRQETDEQIRRRQAEMQARLEDESRRERETIRGERDSLRSERDEARLATDRLTRRAEQLADDALKLDARDERTKAEERQLTDTQASWREKVAEADRRLFEVANLSPEAARDIVLRRLDSELEEEKGQLIKNAVEKANTEAKRRAQIIIAQAIQRSASETTASVAVSVVPIPSDAMKGRIIGREGRNIRAFESLTGVDLIIDDTPEAVILSSFNPIRREVAVKALEQLVADGRIHPTRIEEVVAKAQDEMKVYIHDRGEEAAIEANVVGLKPGLLQLIGRLHFRSSYAQNVLKHSIQVAHVCGLMAAELGLDAAVARRAGLLHDIGKSIDRELEGTHVEIGINLARRFGESIETIDAIAHHHDPENGETVYSSLAAAADAISAARPGARRESLEIYIKRLEQLEAIANSFPGVETAFAIQAGREVRIIVQPDKVSDAKAALLAREIASRIEQDMEYPGQVQVTVVRESRSVDYAR